MKKTLLIIGFVLIALACSKKHTRNLLHSGDYDAAIYTSVENLRGNKHTKRKQE